MAKKELSYTAAMTELEQILSKLNDENLDVDTLAREVKRATELIDLCQQRLKKAETEVAAILEPA